MTKTAKTTKTAPKAIPAPAVSDLDLSTLGGNSDEGVALAQVMDDFQWAAVREYIKAYIAEYAPKLAKSADAITKKVWKSGLNKVDEGCEISASCSRMLVARFAKPLQKALADELEKRGYTLGKAKHPTLDD